MSETSAPTAPATRQISPPWKPMCGLLFRPSEIAALRLNGKQGVGGNQVILRSGVVIPLSYQEAREVKHEIVGSCGLNEEPESPDEFVLAIFR